jgi:hypothetical protein
MSPGPVSLLLSSSDDMQTFVVTDALGLVNPLSTRQPEQKKRNVFHEASQRGKQIPLRTVLVEFVLLRLTAL